MTRLQSLALAAAALLLAAPAAYAQRSPDLQDLHDALHLSPSQEGSWQAFAAASAPDPEQEARERSAQQMMPTLRSPQRVDLSLAAAAADLDTLRRRGSALKAFYATLSAGQQAIFDRETIPSATDQ
jgi:periplasmic protein CpxP/Spy